MSAAAGGQYGRRYRTSLNHSDTTPTRVLSPGSPQVLRHWSARGRLCVTAPTSTALRDGTIGRQSAFCSLVGDPFGRDLAYLFRLVAAHKIDPQLAGELPWDQMPAALERLRNRDVAGSLALTVGG